MDEMYEWLRARRKKRIRITAAVLGVGILLSSIPQLRLTEYERTLANEQQIREVMEFAALSEDVREQTVAFGTTLRELALPDTLEAYVTVKNGENLGGGVEGNGDLEEDPDAPDDDKDGSGDKTEEGNGDGTGEEGDGGETGDEGEGGDGSGDEGAGGGAGDEGEGSGAGDEGESGGETGDEGESGGGSGDEGEGGGETGDEGESSDGSGDEGESEGGAGEENEGESGEDGGVNSESVDDKKESGADKTDGKKEQAQDGKEQARVVRTNFLLPEYRSGAPDIKADTLYLRASAEDAEIGNRETAANGEGTGDEAAPEEGKAAGAQEVIADDAGAGAGGKTDSGTGEEAGGGADAGTGEEAGGGADAETGGASDGSGDVSGDWETIRGVKWECSPSYDKGTPGVYTFRAVLPETYVPAKGVSLPEITVTVQEEEETFSQNYETMSLGEVAPVAAQRDGREWNVSSDNAGDSYRVRVLWQTTTTVSKYASSKYCSNSWVGLKVPGMKDQKFYFDKDMLMDDSTVYVMGEFTLPYTYADQEEIFPTKIGTYSEIASFTSRVFQGTMTLQCYDYIAGEWVSYGQVTTSPDTSDVGGSLFAHERWDNLPKTQNWIAYIDIDKDDLYLPWAEGESVQRSWNMVCMDRFGVPVTDESRGWSSTWELQKPGGGSYPSKDQLSLSGSMESFAITAASGTAGLTEAPVVYGEFRSPDATAQKYPFALRIGDSVLVDDKCSINYYDSKGLIYSKKIRKGLGYTVEDLREIALDRELACPSGRKFAGSYTGSDGKVYRPGDTIIVRSLSLYIDTEVKETVFKLDGQIDEDDNRTITENQVYEIAVTDGKVPETAPIPEHAQPGRSFGGWGVKAADGKWNTVYDKKGELFSEDWRPADGTVLRVIWIYPVYYRFIPGQDAWCYVQTVVFENAHKGVATCFKNNNGFNKLPDSEEEIYRRGYDFVRWTLDGKEFTNDTILPAEPRKMYNLYAEWKPKEMRLSLDANGGTFAGGGTTWEREKNLVYGAALKDVEGEFPMPSRPGYEFAGWGYSADTLVRHTIQPNWKLDRTEDFTLYAVWAWNNITIYLDPNGGGFKSGTVASVKTAPGASVALPVPERPGYTLAGWEDAAGNQSPAGHGDYMVPGDVTSSYTLKAVWKANDYTVRFDKNYGVGNMADLNCAYDVPEALPANTFTRAGYAFDGWNTKADGSGDSYKDQALVSKLTTTSRGTVTLYAQWKAQDWSVSFDPNGGGFADGKTPTKTVKCGSAYGTLPTPQRDQYDFKGWWTSPAGDGTKVEAKTVVTDAEASGGTITLYARWEYAWFTLSFDLKGGVGSGGCTFADMTGRKTAGIVLPKAIPERGADWEFLGWSKNQNAQQPDAAYTREKVLAGVTCKPESGDTEEKITLYAVWHNENPVLEYDANTTDKGVTVPVSQTFANGKATISATKPVRKDFTFQGWALAPDGAAVYQPGGTIYSSVSVRLYAVWKAGEYGVVTDGDVECKYKKDGKWHLTTLKDAIAKVPAEGEIILLKSLNLTETLTLSGSKSYTLDFNHFTLTWAGDYSMAVTGSGKITLKNGTLKYPALTRMQVSGGAKVTMDGIRLGAVAVSGSGTVLTMQGATAVKPESGEQMPMIRITDGASADIQYAEVTGRDAKDTDYRGLIEAENANLTIRDGYFWIKRDNPSSDNLYVSGESVWNPVVRQKGSGSLTLSGGYYSAQSSWEKMECQNWWQSGSVNQTVIATEGASGSYQDGTDVGRVYPALGINSVVGRDHWFTPGKSGGTESGYWGVYEEPGQERKKTLNTPKLANADYLSGDTRFQMLKDRVFVEEPVTLGSADKRAVIDLNGGQLTVFQQDKTLPKADISLSNFVLKNGILANAIGPASTGATSGNVSLGNGVIESDASVVICGGRNTHITLADDLIVEPGAVFYVDNSASLAMDFYTNYVYNPYASPANPKYFGSTVLLYDAEATTSADNYMAFRAGFPPTPAVTFHSNYPEGSGKEEVKEEKDQTVGSAYVLSGAFTAPAGYVFDHWNTKQDGSGGVITASTVYGDASERDVYAIWRRGSYDVTFYRNNGQWADAASLGVTASQTSVSRKISYDSEIGAFPAVTRPGYVFDGWYTAASGGTKVDADTKVTKKTDCYARWSVAGDTKYTVIHEGVTIAGGKVTLGRQEKSGETNKSVTIAGIVQNFDGYTCSGYTVKSSEKPTGTTGTGTTGSFRILADGTVEVTLKYTLNQSQITVTAKKEEAGKTTPTAVNVSVGLSSEGKVTPSGSTMATGTGGEASVTYKYGSGVTLTAKALSGYTFAGWSGDYTASGDSLHFRMPGQAVNVTALYRQITYHVGKDLTHIEAGTEQAQMPGQSAVVLTDERAPHGSAYTLQLAAEEGYEMPERVTLKRNGADSVLETGKASGGMTYTRSADKKTATLTVTNVDTFFVVKAEGTPKHYTASFKEDESQHVSAKPSGSVSVSHGKSFVMTLRAAEGYALPDAQGGTLTVIMGGKTLTADEYDYDTADGSLYIAKVTGDVTAAATARPDRTVYRIAYYRQEEDGTYGDAPYQTTDFSDKMTGDTVDVRKGGTIDPSYAKTYTGYEFDAAADGNETSGVVKADGSLTLKVYYKRSEYKVSLADGCYWDDGTRDEKPFLYGDSVELALQERTGYDVSWSAGTAKGADAQVRFNMPAEDRKVVPVYTPKRFSVLSAGLSHVVFTNDTERSAYYKTAYTATVEPEEGYTLPDEISVKAAGQTLESSRFTYDPDTGRITVSAEAVTGVIEITAAGVEKTWQVRVVFEDNTSQGGGDILSASRMDGMMVTGETFQTRLTVNDPLYVLPDLTEHPDKVKVTMGGVTIAEGSDYFYDKDSGNIRVPDIMGEVIITVSPVDAPPTADYKIEHYKENLDGSYAKAQTVRKKGVLVGTELNAADEQAGLLKSYRGFAFDENAVDGVTKATVAEDGSTVLKLYYKRVTCTLTVAAEEGITADVSGAGTGVSQTVSAGTQAAISFKYGENVTANISQVADGSSFTGWYQAGEMKSKGTDYSILVSEDTSLAAKSRTASYELIVEGTHAASDLPDENYENNIPFGAKKTVGLTADTGYHLPDAVSMIVDGEEAAAASFTYTKEADGSSGKAALVVNGNTHLVLAAEPNHYKLTLDANGGTVKIQEDAQGTKQAQIEAVYDAAYGSLPTATRNGHTFLGWFDDPKDGEEVTAETIHLTAGDTTAYAHWKKQPEKDKGDADKKDPEPGDTGTGEPGGTGSEPGGGEEPPKPAETVTEPDPGTAQEPETETPPASSQPKGVAIIEEKWPEEEDKPGRILPEGEGVVRVPAIMKNDKITPKDKKIWEAGRGKYHTVVFTVMNGAVVVHVNNVNEETCRAGVADAAATANAVLTGEEVKRLVAGDIIEIRIAVTPCDDKVSDRERDMARRTAEQNGGLSAGMYVDFSVYMRINEESWQKIHETRDPFTLVLETPRQLLEESADQVFRVLRIHEEKCTLFADMDEVPETITFESSLFSVYAVMYTPKDQVVADGEAAEREEVDGKAVCGLCHMCPTVWGICCFVWLAFITVLIVIVILIFVWREKKKEEGGAEY